jgi:hypothetical protein
MPNVIPLDIDKAAFSGAPAPAGLGREKAACERRRLRRGIGYSFQMGLQPQTRRGMRIPPSAWRRISSITTRAATPLITRVFNGQSDSLTRDDILDNVTITWLTNTGSPAACGRTGGVFFAVKELALVFRWL